MSDGPDDLGDVVVAFLFDGFEDGLGYDADGDVVALGAIQLEFLIRSAFFALPCAPSVIP